LHPLEFIESFLANEVAIREVHFSIYRYHPQSLLDDCITHRVEVHELRSTYERLAARLKENEDVAFNSLVRLRGNTGARRHLALLDFQTGVESRVEQISEALVAENCPRQAALVYSGQSYHLYLGTLFSHTQWVKFMGRILLLNSRSEPPTVDARWVGHRLMAGYSALRWSSKGKPQTPVVVRQW
jgi:hypothetical protein